MLIFWIHASLNAKVQNFNWSQDNGTKEVAIYIQQVDWSSFIHFLPPFLAICFDLDDLSDWLLVFEIFIYFFISAFFFAAVWVSLAFEALFDTVFFATSFYLSSFLEDETFWTTTTFSVFLTVIWGFFTGAGFFLAKVVVTDSFLGLVCYFFSIFLDAFLICNALLSVALELDCFCFWSFCLESLALFFSGVLVLIFSDVLDYEILESLDFLESLLGGVFNFSGDNLIFDLDWDFYNLTY